MDIRKMTEDELEKLSYVDMAYNVLKFDKKVLNTVDLLKEICSVLKYGDKEFEELIGDFYTSLNLDKRFILIEGKWDLTENHSIKILVEDDLDDDIEDYDDVEDDEDEDEVEDEAISSGVEVLEDIEDDLEDDMEELAIVDEEEEEETEEDV